MSSVLRCLAGLAALLLSSGSPLWAQASTEAIFSGTRAQLYQVQVLDRISNSKVGIGSGFLISGQRLVTNFHVIADLLLAPEKHTGLFVHDDGPRGALELLAVDVVHDLAVLRSDDLPSIGALTLAQSKPEQGGRLWALGNPYDLGLTIVEGTYNGHLEQSLYQRIHFTGSINPGMSGGPTVNAAAEVVGINVATAGNQVSFLVPVAYLQALIARSAEGPLPSHEQLLAQLRDGLLENQEHTLQPLLEQAFPVSQLGPYQITGALGDFINCWGGTNDDQDSKFSKSVLNCQSGDQIFLSSDQRTGEISYTHELFQSKTMGRLRFYQLLEQHLNESHRYVAGSDDQVGDFRCHSSFVSIPEADGQARAKFVLCQRDYLKIKGLHDLFMAGNTLDHDRRSLYATLTLTGVGWSNGQHFARRFLESLRVTAP